MPFTRTPLNLLSDICTFDKRSRSFEWHADSKMLIILAVFTLPIVTTLPHKTSVDAETCEDFPWLLKTYESVNIGAPNQNTLYCIQSNVASCVKLSPINFIRGNIEVIVFFAMFSEKSNLVVSVYDENETPIVMNTVNRLSVENNQWNTILLTIERSFFGYVSFFLYYYYYLAG